MLQQTTFACGRSANTHGQRVGAAFLLESAARFARSHSVFGRAERIEKNELFI